MPVVKVQTNRDSSIELLRIISMLGVFILHYNIPKYGAGFDYVTPGTVNQLAMNILVCVFIVAVNLFVLI